MSEDQNQTATGVGPQPDADGLVTVRIPARAAAMINAELEASVSPGAIKFQRYALWIFVIIPLFAALFGLKQVLADQPEQRVFDLAFVFVPLLIGAGGYAIREYNVRIWRRAGLI